jgi:GxxExxY protein
MMNRRDAETQRVNEITEKIIGCAIEVHRQLGPGLLESAYEECTCHETVESGLQLRRQIPLPVTYKGVHLDCGYRMDAIVESLVVVEFKTVERLMPVHEAQLLSYLKLSGLSVGLLINFHVPVLKDGLRRIVNHLGELSASPRLRG